MLSEPEAAAVFTARYLKEKSPDRTLLKVQGLVFTIYIQANSCRKMTPLSFATPEAEL